MGRNSLRILKWPVALVLVTALLFSLGSALPVNAAEPSRDFQETGHTVSGDFLTFFDGHGGLGIFGYPLTDEIVEDGRTVQYFQRARMELWPENPLPYRVQLGLLGVQLGKAEPGLESQPAGDSDTRYFPETGHTVKSTFKDFWEHNGGLDIFGYPITEQQEENGLVVQYFQRARFELHPDSPNGSQIQLGSLGEEYLALKAQSSKKTEDSSSTTNAEQEATTSSQVQDNKQQNDSHQNGGAGQESSAGESAAGPQPADTAPESDSPNAPANASLAPQPNDTASKTATTTSSPSASSSPVRVGVQAGHWKSAELPAELAGLRTSTGTSGGGVSESELTLDIAKRVASLLQTYGIQVDVLPATVPPAYQADAFVSLHADGDASGKRSGFKVARASRSAIPGTDDALVTDISEEYQAATNLPVDPNVTRNMTAYYAFNNRSFQHAIAKTTPAAILEMGFLTNASDRTTLLDHPDTVAKGIAQGILRFLGKLGESIGNSGSN